MKLNAKLNSTARLLFACSALALLALGCSDQYGKEKVQRSGNDIANFSYQLTATPSGDVRTECSTGVDSCYQSLLFFQFHYVITDLQDAFIGANLQFTFYAAFNLPGTIGSGYPIFTDQNCFTDPEGYEVTGFGLDSITSSNISESSAKVSFSPSLTVEAATANFVIDGGICIVVETLDPTSLIHPSIDSLGTVYLEVDETSVKGVYEKGIQKLPECARCELNTNSGS